MGFTDAQSGLERLRRIFQVRSTRKGYKFLITQIEKTTTLRVSTRAEGQIVVLLEEVIAFGSCFTLDIL